MKNRIIFSFLLSFTGLLCFGQMSSKEILAKAIKAHGGSSYKKVNTIAYTKIINHFDKQGAIVDTVVEYHTIDFNKSASMFSWSSDEVTFIAMQNKDSVSLQVNGVYTDDPSKLTRTENSLKAATYVFWQPFKLIDPKAIISSKGIRVLFNDWEVYDLEVRYPNSEDQWHFYFDTKTFLLKATGVLFKKRYSLIVNDLQENDTGLKLNAKRTSYRTNKNFNPNRVKTKYRYEITSFR